MLGIYACGLGRDSYEELLLMAAAVTILVLQLVQLKEEESQIFYKKQAKLGKGKMKRNLLSRESSQEDSVFGKITKLDEELNKISLQCLKKVREMEEYIKVEFPEIESQEKYDVERMTRQMEEIFDDEDQFGQIMKILKTLEVESKRCQKAKNLYKKIQRICKDFEEMKGKNADQSLVLEILEEIEFELRERFMRNKSIEKAQYLEGNNTQDEAEEREVKLEELQQFTETIIKEKNGQINELEKGLKGFVRDIDEVLVKISKDEMNVKVENVAENDEENLKDKKLLAKDDEIAKLRNENFFLSEEIRAKDEALDKIQEDYIRRDLHNQAMNKMQAIINEDRKKYSDSFNSIQEKIAEEEKKFLTNKDNMKLLEFPLGIEKEDEKVSVGKKSKGKESNISNVSEPRSVTGKRRMCPLLLNDVKSAEPKRSCSEKSTIGKKNAKIKGVDDMDDQDLKGFQVQKKLKSSSL